MTITMVEASWRKVGNQDQNCLIMLVLALNLIATKMGRHPCDQMTNVSYLARVHVAFAGIAQRRRSRSCLKFDARMPAVTASPPIAAMLSTLRSHSDMIKHPMRSLTDQAGRRRHA